MSRGFEQVVQVQKVAIELGIILERNNFLATGIVYFFYFRISGAEVEISMIIGSRGRKSVYILKPSSWPPLILSSVCLYVCVYISYGSVCMFLCVLTVFGLMFLSV